MTGNFELVLMPTSSGIGLRKKGADSGFVFTSPLSLDFGKLRISMLGQHTYGGRSSLHLEASLSESGAFFRFFFEVRDEEPFALVHWRFSVDRLPSCLLDRICGPEWRLDLPDQGKAFRVHVQQAPMCTGLLYFSELSSFKSTVLYIQDFGELNSYFEVTKTCPRGRDFKAPLGTLESGIVGFDGEAFGLKLPRPRRDESLEKHSEVTLSDGYLVFAGRLFEDELALMDNFIRSLAVVYRNIRKPPTRLHDWSEVAERTLLDLHDKRNWVTVNGLRFLKAYVNDERRTPELISQNDVLRAVRRYTLVHGHDQLSEALDRTLTDTLEYFYDESVGSVLNQPYSVRRLSDSWYYVTGLLDLFELAELGNAKAGSVFIRSLEKLLGIAQKLDYKFPIFFDPLDVENSARPSDEIFPPMEYDVAGAYALLMVRLFRKTGDKVYLREASKAIEKILGNGFTLLYETHVTAMTVAACAELYETTGDGSYVQLSTLPLANILRNSWLWRCEYGYAKEYATFFGLVPMTYACVITPKEQYESWIHLRKFTSDVYECLNDETKLLLAEFHRYTLSTMWSSLAPLRRPESVAEKPIYQPTVRANSKELFIPLEDIRDGWEESGLIGQEVYGAGMALTFATELPVRINGATLRCEYPTRVRNGRAVEILGPGREVVELRLLGGDATLNLVTGNLDFVCKEGGELVFRVTGGSVVEVVWPGTAN